MILLVVGTITGILIEMYHIPIQHMQALSNSRQACADKYLPQNTTKYDICIGGMGPNDNGSRIHLRS